MGFSCTAIPRDRPEVAGLGAAPPGIEHRCAGLIDHDLGRGQYDLLHPQINRLDFGRGGANPTSQCRAIDRQALQPHDLCLPI
jgi:hypothetical protein